MEETALEEQAVDEILKDLKRGAERAKEHGALGWQKNPLPPTNKRFLRNMLVSTLRDDRPLNHKRKFNDGDRSEGPSNKFQDWTHTRRKPDSSLRGSRYPERGSSGDSDRGDHSGYYYDKGDKGGGSVDKFRDEPRYSNKRARHSGSDSEKEKGNGETDNKSEKKHRKRHKKKSEKDSKDSIKKKHKKSKKSKKHKSKKSSHSVKHKS